MELEVSEQVLEVTKEQVHREMMDYAQKYRYKNTDDLFGSNGYFEKWPYLLPGSFSRQALEKDDNILDQPLGPQTNEYKTELFKQQTTREFFAIIDKAIEIEGLDINKVRQLSEGYSKMTSRTLTTDASKRKELEKYVFPAYIRLRAMGYTHYDLADTSGT